MFLKPYKVKNNTPLKSSEVKKLRQRIQNEYPTSNPDLLISSKANVSVLKLVTHGNFHTNIYCADKMPMFFENECKHLVPTLYSLWKVSDLLPYFTTHAGVLPKLCNGADLMLPGVIPQGTGMNTYGHHKKGQLVNLSSNKSAVGVGYLPRSSDDLYMCAGHGVAVKMLHLFGDKLWGHEPSLVQQVPQLNNARLTDDDFPALGAKHTNKENELHKENGIQDLLYQRNLMADSLMPKQKFDNISQNIDLKNEKAESNNTENSGNTPELILKNAFLAALKNHGKNLQLPLLTSNFFRLYIVPEAQEPLDLKKTKYKKLSNFLNEMIDQGFIVIREETKGVDKITSIDLDHPELVNFITDYKKPNSELTENPLFHSELTELYIVTDVTAPFFAKFNYKQGEGIPASQIKKIVKEYVCKQNLPMTKNPNMEDKSFILDEYLEKICNTNVASLNQITNDLIAHMDHSYQMCIAKDIKGNKPMIQMSLATRSGNKKVTLVSNIQCYGIILAEFIKLCKQGAAASTTIVTLPNQNREMLQIQGNQIRFVYNLLTETYKIPPKCILGLELAKDGKKHKKK
ncbi:eukaryotic translation initiation factor 2D isoform 2-T2 [Cochliomyia hominivorax]